MECPELMARALPDCETALIPCLPARSAACMAACCYYQLSDSKCIYPLPALPGTALRVRQLQFPGSDRSLASSGPNALCRTPPLGLTTLGVATDAATLRTPSITAAGSTALWLLGRTAAVAEAAAVSAAGIGAD
jgi:hypothetical protein